MNRLTTTLALTLALGVAFACSSADKKEAAKQEQGKEAAKGQPDGGDAGQVRKRGTGDAESTKAGKATDTTVTVAGEPDAAGNIALPGPVQTKLVAEQGAKLQSKPGVGAEVIQEIPSGATVTVTGYRRGIYIIDRKPGRWVEVDAAGKSGWVFGGYLEGPSVATGGALPQESVPKE